MKKLKSCTKVLDAIENNKDISLAGVSTNSAKAFLLSRFLEEWGRGSLFLGTDEEVVSKMMNDFKIWSGMPAVKLSDLSTKGEMLAILSGENPGMVFGITDDIKNIEVPSKDAYTGAFLTLKSGTRMSQVELFEHLIKIGYEAEEGELTTKGRFYRRGGMVDIYLVNRRTPIRLEFFEDQIDSIFDYNILSGKKVDDLDEVVLYPVDVETKNEGIDSYLTDVIVFLDEVDELFTVKSKNIVRFTPFVNKEHDTVKLNFASLFRYHTPLDFVVDLKKKLEHRWKIYIFGKDKEKIWNFLVSKEFRASELDEVEIFGNGHLETWLTQQELYRTKVSNLNFPEAFVNDDEKVMCVTAKEIFGAGGTSSVDEGVGNAFLGSLEEGDLVVHINHGIGLFQGMSRNTFGGVEREYLVIEYAKGDKLYVPVDKAEKINKYLGVESPNLTALGSTEWETVTRKIKEDTDRIAKELLDIYARRKIAKGHSFEVDDDTQKEFEADFEHDLTPGQAKAMAEIKADMEKGKPMDRLLCGDVGFGKTEVAMRAAFKAVRSGKQVAFLAPITILADQHYRSFIDRMDKYKVRIDQLSRFKTPKEQQVVLKKLAEGNLDIVIGTHRLLSKDIVFKDLGLVIVDEEQRFGVKQKEQLKDMRSDVDMLALTATPIPRTLNMGLSGLRDISTINTPPPGRLPVHTEIRRFTYPLIRDAIMREVERKGQAYFLHNRVSTIESVAEKLRNMMPELRIVVTHGQLNPHELEKRIIGFKNHEYDVLVSSTIIENGIDLSNANTLIVDRAEAFGLAQAYQLRGRVGRSSKQAYAYFLYQAQQLQPDAKKRLKAIMDASDLGSGFQIAMKDLDIRGAGEILGSKQHGAISTIGVAHFTKILNDTVDKLKASDAERKFADENEEINVDLTISTFLPDDYLPDSGAKLKWYQRISGTNKEETLMKLKKELIEKYGDVGSAVHE